ncbi:MAG: RidA family protein [Flavobacteriales bacterium]
MSFDKKFLALVGKLKAPAGSKGDYVMYKRVGNMLYLSGYGPIRNGKIPPEYQGQVDAGGGTKYVTPKQAAEAARLTALNLLWITREAIKTLNNVQEIVSVEGFVASTDSFTGQPAVMDGCSKVLVEVFGSKGKHTRSAIGTSTLAFGICVEIQMTLVVK